MGGFILEVNHEGATWYLTLCLFVILLVQTMWL